MNDPWRIDESEFYELDDPRAQKEFLLRYAVLAPSGHNTQPWSFRLTDEGVEVYADTTRRLPVADPHDRELLISVGAAITNFRVAAAHFGFDTNVLYRDRPAALITMRETCAPDRSLRALFTAITQRHTNRGSFEHRPIDPEALDCICTLVESSEMTRCVLPQESERIAELVEEADHRLLADEAWRTELAEWVRTNESTAGDGIPAEAFGIPGPLSAFAPYLLRNIDLGDARGRADRTLAQEAAGLIVISSDDDRPALVQAGETLERLLLTLTSLGVQYSFLNQPVQVPELRRELWDLVRTPKPPQVLLRIGYAQPVRRAMPRRPVSSVSF
ncbi:MAG TPA: nitroreductase [Thermoanaerobaculia bacterium]